MTVTDGRPDLDAQGEARNYALLRRAVRERLQVVATYRGHRRQLCVHALGHRTEGGTEGDTEASSEAGVRHARALAYQFGGDSGSGLSDNPADNWRCLRVADLADIRLRPGPWHTAPNYALPHPCIEDLDVAVPVGGGSPPRSV